MLSYEAALAAAMALVPLMLIGAYLDLRYLRLPNWLAIACFGLFLAIAVADIALNDATGMTWSLMGWRVLYGAIALVAGFVLFSVGVVGGGDVKLLAACVPFIAPIDLASVLVIYCVAALVGVLAVWLLNVSKLGARTGWATWATRNERGRLNFPWGVALAATMILYLVLRVLSYGDLAPA